MVFAGLCRDHDELWRMAWLVLTVRAVAGDTSAPSTVEGLIGPPPSRGTESEQA